MIDGDPASSNYGQLVATGASGVKTQQMHHTEYWMPESGFLFVNDHAAGRAVVMDLRDPLHPKVHASFGDLAGHSRPHSFLRLPNGHVLASFQIEGHVDHGAAEHLLQPMPNTDSGKAVHGGVVEIDEEGKVIRAASTADPARPDDLLMAYRGPDGSVFIQTTGCGIERITALADNTPRAKLVYQFPGSFCGVPNIVSHYLIQTVRLGHAVVVIDIANPEHPVEVSRAVIDGWRLPRSAGPSGL